MYVGQNLIIPEMTALNSCAREYQIRNCENARLSEEFPSDMGSRPRILAKAALDRITQKAAMLKETNQLGADLQPRASRRALAA
jgi:hypothetical protein